MKLIASTMLYALGKRLGMAGALREFQRQMSAPAADSLPVVRTFYRMQMMTELQAWVDCGATIIGKGRSRAFYEARQTDCDVWISCDDDVEVSTTGCGAMLEVLADELVPRVVVVPFMLRSVESINPRLNVDIPLVRVEEFVAGTKLVRLPHPARAGFAMVGMNRKAIERIARKAEETGALTFEDHDGKKKLALFHDELDGGMWYGEDISFFRRVPDDVAVHALLSGTSNHDGIPVDLERL